MQQQKYQGQITQALVIAALLCAFTLPIALALEHFDYAARDNAHRSIFVTFNLFRAQDIWAGPIIAIAVVAAWIGSRRHTLTLPTGIWFIYALAIAAVGLTAAFRILAHHNFDLSLDEFMPTFQAEIFRSGQLMAPIDATKAALAHSLQPFFAYIDLDRLVWASHYRPVHAALLALFPAGQGTFFLNSFLAGVAVVAIASVARQIFPDRSGAPTMAAILLISSPQFIALGGAGFAFAAHLSFNLVWLALFLRGKWLSHIAAALVGFFAVGLHQVHVHAFFVAPFGVALLAGYFGTRQFAWPYILAYSAAMPIWIMWPEIAIWLQTGDATVLPGSFWEIDYVANYINHSSENIGGIGPELRNALSVVNISRFLVWVSPALPLLGILALLRLRGLGVVPTIALASLVLTVVAVHFLMPNQMQTWGARYYHPVLGCLIVVAMAAIYSLKDSEKVERAISACMILAIFGLVVLIPWRAWQVHVKVGPRTAVQEQLMSSEADVVVLDYRDLWLPADFVRNSPYLRNRPLLLVGTEPDNFQLQFGDVQVLDRIDLIEMGLPVGTFLEPDKGP
jgi:hypothetical protein